MHPVLILHAVIGEVVGAHVHMPLGTNHSGSQLDDSLRADQDATGSIVVIAAAAHADLQLRRQRAVKSHAGSLSLMGVKQAVAAGIENPTLGTVRLQAERAELRYRGFSKTDSDRRLPEIPVYDTIANVTQRWRDLVGYYTRFGDVRELAVVQVAEGLGRQRELLGGNLGFFHRARCQFKQDANRNTSTALSCARTST
jgi:hypothetical protein